MDRASALELLTAQTLEEFVMKAQTSGLLTSTGIAGYDLSQLVSLVPVNTPWRNFVPRVTPEQGAQTAVWRALLNVNSAQPDPAVGADNAGSLAVISEQDVSAPFVPLALGGTVTEDAIDLAGGYANASALARLYTLNQLMIGEDKLGIGGNAIALPTIATPTLTTATTGGSIGNAGTTVHVKVAARSGRNFFYGGSGVASSDASVTCGTTTSTNSVTASVTAVPGAVAYDWFVGSSSSNQVYYTTTTVNTVVITSVPTAAQALPSLPDLSTVQPTTPPTADSSFTTKDFNGLLTTILADYGSSSAPLVTRGSGTNNGAYFASADGAALSAVGSSLPLLDTLNLSLWNTVRLSPSAYMISGQEANSIAKLILNTNLAVTYLQPSDATGRSEVIVGGRAAAYINKACPDAPPIKLEVQPHVPPGTLVARCDRIPFPGANIDSVFEFRTKRDYYTFEYGAARLSTAGGGPREDFEVRVRETFINRAAVAQGVISNIAPA